MLSCAAQQIISAYEKCNLSVEDIAENFEMEPEAIRAILSGSSHKYRMDQKQATEGLVTKEDVTADEMAEMLSIIKSIAREQRHDSPTAARKAAEFVYNEGKGRNNLAGLATSGINVLVINQRLSGMKQARERIAASKQERKAIEV